MVLDRPLSNHWSQVASFPASPPQCAMLCSRDSVQADPGTHSSVATVAYWKGKYSRNQSHEGIPNCYWFEEGLLCCMFAGWWECMACLMFIYWSCKSLDLVWSRHSHIFGLIYFFCFFGEFKKINDETFDICQNC